MSNGFKKLAEMLGKMDDKVLQAKINAAVDMLKNSDKEELAKKLGKVDKSELLSKLNEIDEEKLKDLNLNKNDLKQKMDSIDMNEVQKLLGDKGPEIMNKIKDIIG